MKLGSDFDTPVAALVAELERKLTAAKALQAYGQQVNSQTLSDDAETARAITQEVIRLAEQAKPTPARSGSRLEIQVLISAIQSAGNGVLQDVLNRQERERQRLNEVGRRRDRAAAFNELEAAQEAERELLRQGEAIPEAVEERVVKARSRWGFFGRRAG
jgi:hypothetical protein